MIARASRSECCNSSERVSTDTPTAVATIAMVVAANPSLRNNFFAADYRNETPVHPARGFVGREHSGTRADGSRHLMRGVMISGVADGMADWVCFYLEPVDSDIANVDIALARHLLGEGVPRYRRSVARSSGSAVRTSSPSTSLPRGFRPKLVARPAWPLPWTTKTSHSTRPSTVLCEPSCLVDDDPRDEQSDEPENENARGHSAGFSSTSGISRFVFVW